MAEPERIRDDEFQPEHSEARRDSGGLRALGLGLITGAADDDCSAIGTYASAGAKFGPAMLWTAPVTLPMMFTVVYLSSKLGQVSGRGLFHAIRDYMPAGSSVPRSWASCWGHDRGGGGPGRYGGCDQPVRSAADAGLDDDVRHLRRDAGARRNVGDVRRPQSLS